MFRWNNKVPLFSHLVLKPTLTCTASCKTCSTRKVLHRNQIRNKKKDINYWKEMFAEVDRLGVTKLTISGGEPTLYPHLLELIREGKKYHWEVGLNTNGSLIDEPLAEQLLDSGLDMVSLSIYSHSPKFHDQIRGHRGLWEKAIKAATIFAHLRDSVNSTFRVAMQTIICKANYRDFPKLMELANRTGFCYLTFSYLEGDFKERKYLLDSKQIIFFQNSVKSDVQKVITETVRDPWTRRIAVSAVKSIYPETVSFADYARGIYRRPQPCQIPKFFSIVLANGDVHPCNMVEYSHQPVMGNLFEKSFKEIWAGDQWNRFRKNGFDLCRFCPVPEQVVIPVTRRPDYAWIHYMMKNPRFKPLMFTLKRIIYSRKTWLSRIRKDTKRMEEIKSPK